MHSLIFGAKNFFERTRHEPISASLAALAATLTETVSIAPEVLESAAMIEGEALTAPVVFQAPTALSSALTSVANALPSTSTVLSAASFASGIGGKLQAANTANTQADMYAREAKLAEQRQIQRDQALIAKEHANAGASGLVASSGSPLSTTMASTDDLRTNAAAARYPGEMQAASRRMEANNYYAQIPGMLGDALSPRPGSVLGFLMDRRRSY